MLFRRMSGVPQIQFVQLVCRLAIFVDIEDSSDTIIGLHELYIPPFLTTGMACTNIPPPNFQGKIILN